MNRKEIAEQYPELLVADGFDKAIIGVARTFNKLSVCYDTNKCINILVKRDKMSREEAIEYFEYNVVGAYMGEHTPSFIDSSNMLDVVFHCHECWLEKEGKKSPSSINKSLSDEI